jgi:acyl-CoA thioesterase
MARMTHADPFSELLGLEVEEASRGSARLRATVLAEHVNQHGTVHGGFVFALADTALAVAANSHGPEAVAIAASISYTRPAEVGDVLVAEAEEVSRSARVASYRISVRSGEELIAAFMGTVSRRA